MTNVPGITFGPRGFVVPTDAEILAGVIADINAAFGGGLNPALETPQGQLATSQAAIIAAADQTFAALAQQMDPAFNYGRFQDAIGRIYYLTRNPAAPTSVACTCTGAAGTIIPTGSLAQDITGGLYACTTGGAIGLGGTVTLNFVNTVMGPIPCPAATLTQIYQAIPGWDSITNPADGVLGNDVETRQEFEDRRVESVAKNARGTIQAIQGAVLAVPNVLDAFSYQNDDDDPVVYRGVTLAPHSIYVAVVGGDDLAVATAIWTKKSPGCAYNGGTTVTVQDTSPGYAFPYPTYQVVFQRPTPTTISFAISIAANPQVPADAADQIKAAIIAAFAGSDNGPRARIGSTIYASRFVCPVAALGPWVRIISLQLGIGTPNQDDVVLDIDQAPVTSAADIAVTVV